MILGIFTLSNIISLIFGIGVGLIWGAVIFIKNKKKIVIDNLSPEFKELDNTKQEEIEEIISNVTKYHLKTRKKHTILGIVNVKDRTNYQKLAADTFEIECDERVEFSKELFYLVDDIASTYYPNSKYPIFEITIDELFNLLNNIIDRIDLILKESGIPDIEKLKLSTIYSLVTTYNKSQELMNKKGIKITISVVKAAFVLKNLLTPFYWIKRSSTGLSTNSLYQLAISAVFEIVGKEAAIIYNK